MFDFHRVRGYELDFDFPESIFKANAAAKGINAHSPSSIGTPVGGGGAPFANKEVGSSINNEILIMNTLILIV